ncbi:CU044_5270 family protein [Streptomyces sp. NPDC006995]|uniref:CU044_5270 family protein n=1 Tax=unclassified Streptomyces TaxID=2593676 RepID=UPI0033D24421
MHVADKLLRLLDPARMADPVMSEEEAEMLRIRTISSESHLSRPHPRRRMLVWASAVAVTVAVALVGVGLVGGPAQDSAYAATPAPLQLEDAQGVPAADTLQQLARAAEKGPTPDSGRVKHFRYETWSLFTSIDGDRVTSEVVPQSYETWQQPDGSTRQVQTSNGTSTTDDFPSTDRPDPPDTPTPESMKQWVLSQGDGTGAGAFLNRLNERSLDTVLTPQQNAGILRALASFDGVEYNGSAQDRSGRTGLAFSVESDFGGLPKKQTTIFDPDTGRLLAYEEMLTEDAGELNVRIPSVTEYTTHLSSSYSN